MCSWAGRSRSILVSSASLRSVWAFQTTRLSFPIILKPWSREARRSRFPICLPQKTRAFASSMLASRFLSSKVHLRRSPPMRRCSRMRKRRPISRRAMESLRNAAALLVRVNSATRIARCACGSALIRAALRPSSPLSQTTARSLTVFTRPTKANRSLLPAMPLSLCAIDTLRRAFSSISLVWA